MGAHVQKLDLLQQAYMMTITWMELVYKDAVWILDIDLDTGQAFLYGETDDTARFKTELKEIMERYASNKFQDKLNEENRYG